LPFGTVAMRVGLASAIAGALAAAQTAALGRDLSARVRHDLDGPPAPRVDDALGAAAGLAFGLSYAAAFQSVRPEVYALSAWLVLSTLRALVRFDATGERRALYLGSLWAGLALTNHHLLAIAAIAPAALVVLARRPRPHAAAAVARVLTGGALGLALIAYLPLRASRHPLVDWGAPTTFARTFWTVSAQAFQKSVAARGSPADLPVVAAAIARELNLVGALLALAGGYLLVRRPRLWRTGLALLLAALADATTPALVGFDPANPDAYGYLEVAIAVFAVLACVLPAALSARTRAPVGLAVGGVLTALALVAGLLAFPRVSLAGDQDAARTLGRWLGSAPPRAVIVTSYFQTVFGVWYLASVDGARPDCDLVHRHFLAYPGYRDEVVRRRPSLDSMLGAHDVIAAPSAIENRPLVVEYDLDLPPAFVDSSTVIPDPAPSDEPQARRFAAWQAFLAAHRACRLGDPALFARTLADARRLIGPSSELDALAATCPAQK
jgi:hypothetical protein